MQCKHARSRLLTVSLERPAYLVRLRKGEGRRLRREIPNNTRINHWKAVGATERGKLKRGDLLFWKGHVAIARDAETIVHANAHHMATVIEKTLTATARIKAAGSELLAIKRL